MSGLSFLAPWWALMGLLAIPIIVLYILRQKRPDMPISSTLLWSKTLADMRASTPFQKLRNNLLLLLQLLILAAMTLALMRPVIQAKASPTQAGVIVIDATASMQTRDGGAQETRLDRAKAEARKLIDSMRPGDQYMLIADGGGMNQSRSGFSASKSELRSRIDAVEASDTPSDLSESLLLAVTSLRAKGARSPNDRAAENVIAGKIWLFSDGSGIRLPDVLGDKNELNFVRIGSSDHNVGITRFSITPVAKEPGTYQVFVGLKNDWPVQRKVGVTLAYETPDHFLPNQAKFVTLPANAPGADVNGGSGSVVFESVTVQPGRIFARVDEAEDDYPLDNTAYGIIAPPQKVRVVLVTAGEPFLERAVATLARLGQAEGQVVAPEFYNPNAPADLFIFDGFVPPSEERMPRTDVLLVRPSMKGAAGTVDVGGFRVSNTIDNPAVLRWKREDPIMANLELGELRIANALLLDKDPAAVDLISAPEGALLAYKDFGPARRYLLSFSPSRDSNWYRVTTAIMFIQNLVEQTRLRHFIGMPQMLAAGNPAKIWGGAHDQEKETAVRVTLPDGRAQELPAREGVADFGQTDKLGIYQATWPGEGAGRQSLFAVNLLSPAESDIRPQSLQTTPGSNVEEHDQVAVSNKEIWTWIAVAALAILLLEWWAYHRRVA